MVNLHESSLHFFAAHYSLLSLPIYFENLVPCSANPLHLASCICVIVNAIVQNIKHLKSILTCDDLVIAREKIFPYVWLSLL